MVSGESKCHNYELTMTETKRTSLEGKVKTLEMNPWEAGAISVGRNTRSGGRKERKRMGTEEVKKRVESQQVEGGVGYNSSSYCFYCARPVLNTSSQYLSQFSRNIFFSLPLNLNCGLFENRNHLK